jgi:hypothetical protein
VANIYGYTIMDYNSSMSASYAMGTRIETIIIETGERVLKNE